MAEAVKGQFEGIGTAYKGISPARDIAAFTKAEGSGQDRPSPFPFASPAVIVQNMEARNTSKRRSKAP